MMESGRIGVFALLAGFVCSVQPALAEGPDAWIPARWQGGPLEIERRTRDRTLPDDPALRETIRRWYDPATLNLLEGSPINCLLLTWSAGGEPETEKQQQELVKVYTREARKRGIAVLGLIYPPVSPLACAAPAAEAGLAGLVFEGTSPGGARDSVAVQQALRRKKPAAVAFPIAAPENLSSSLEVLATSDAATPGLREPAVGADATPSSEPWIDSNIWLAHFIRSRGGPRPIWLAERLSAQASVTDLLRAVADADAGGGRWIVSLTDELRHGLLRKQPEATAAWRRITACLAFRKQHGEWQDYEPSAVYGFILDSAGKEPEVSKENLNLAFRQRIPTRIIDRAHLSAAALEGLLAVHAIDLVQPTDSERRLLTSFAENGGLVVAGRSWRQIEVPKNQDFTMLQAGKGRVVVYRDEWPDPGGLAKDLVDLLGRDRLGVRLFRATSVLCRMSSNQAGSRRLLRFVNYASYPAESMLVRIAGDFRAASFYSPEEAPVELVLDKSGGQVEVTIPKLAVYGILLLEK